MYNCSIGNAPQYLIELLKPNKPKRTLRSSESSMGSYVVPFNNRTFSDRSFSCVGPSQWNQLPLCLRQSKSVEQFKKQLKTHMFGQFYNLF